MLGHLNVWAFKKFELLFSQLPAKFGAELHVLMNIFAICLQSERDVPIRETDARLIFAVRVTMINKINISEIILY